MAKAIQELARDLVFHFNLWHPGGGHRRVEVGYEFGPADGTLQEDAVACTLYGSITVPDPDEKGHTPLR